MIVPAVLQEREAASAPESWAAMVGGRIVYGSGNAVRVVEGDAMRVLVHAGGYLASEWTPLLASALAARDTFPEDAKPVRLAAMRWLLEGHPEAVARAILNGMAASLLAFDEDGRPLPTPRIVEAIKRTAQQSGLLDERASLHGSALLDRLPGILVQRLLQTKTEREAFRLYLRKGIPPVLTPEALHEIALARPVTCTWEMEARYEIAYRDGQLQKSLLPESASQGDSYQTALDAIEIAIRAAEALTQHAAEQHLRAFREQMRAKLGIERIALNEPNLPVELTKLTLPYLHTLQKLLDQLSQSIEPEAKALDPKQPLLPQVRERLDIERVRQSRRVKQRLDETRQQAVGITHYVWRTVEDDKVRASHALNDGELFAWNAPPATGHPGHDYNCRCWAEPTVKELGEPRVEIAVVGVDDVVIATLAAAIATAIAAVETARRLPPPRVLPPDDPLLNEKPEDQPDDERRDPLRPTIRNHVGGSSPDGPHDPNEDPEDEKPERDKLKRPEGVPEEWIRKPTRDDEGVQYEDPNDPGTYVKIKRGNPNSSQPGQQYDNVRWQKNGQSLDANGNPVPRKSQESHIPLEDFTFRPELFR